MITKKMYIASVLCMMISCMHAAENGDNNTKNVYRQQSFAQSGEHKHRAMRDFSLILALQTLIPLHLPVFRTIDLSWKTSLSNGKALLLNKSLMLPRLRYLFFLPALTSAYSHNQQMKVFKKLKDIPDTSEPKCDSNIGMSAAKDAWDTATNNYTPTFRDALQSKQDKRGIDDLPDKVNRVNIYNPIRVLGFPLFKVFARFK